jgi:hypothetical protein
VFDLILAGFELQAMFPGFKLFGVDLDNYTIDSV